MHTVRILRAVGLAEGVSWLVLLFIAMPLKYGFDRPEAVRVVGMAHGVLFMTFMLSLFWAHAERAWGVARSLRYFVAALLPFGFFFVERSLKDEIAAEAAVEA